MRPDGPATSPQDEHLNDYLDAIALEQSPPRGGLDPQLAATARRLFGMAARTDAGPDLKQQIWEELMHTQIQRSTLPLSVLPRLPIAPPAAIDRSPRAAHREHRQAWFGATATVTFVLVMLVLAISALQSRTGGDAPHTLPAAQAATAIAGDVAVQSTIAACDVAPRALDDVAQLLQDAADSTIVLPTPLADASLALPEGAAPDSATVAAIDALYGRFWGCVLANDSLRVAALQSDDAVLRTYFPEGRANINSIMALNDPPNPGQTPTDLLGQPVPRRLYGFRMIGPDRIGAYYVSATQVAAATPTAEERDGYVVFVRSGNGWVVDGSGSHAKG